jgi:predicted site-specific integrase-resolvase
MVLDMHNDLAETLIGSAEASELLHIDRSTVSRWVKAGKLVPAVKGSGIRGEIFFRRDDIEALANPERMSA